MRGSLGVGWNEGVEVVSGVLILGSSAATTVSVLFAPAHVAGVCLASDEETVFCVVGLLVMLRGQG